MKAIKTSLLASALLLIASSGDARSKKTAPVITANIAFATDQVQRMVDSMEVKTEEIFVTGELSKIPSPRTAYSDNKTTYTSLRDWTSGFFPGTLWYLYEMTGDDRWKQSAVKYTEGMEEIKYYTGNHDIGFMIFCSFGNGLRLTDKEHYKEVIVTAAETLTKRFRPEAGIIQSWPPRPNKDWICPVIIDNMMNLELLFEATGLSGDSTFWNIAVSHADKTIENHFRPDMSTYHVVDYDPETGAIRHRQTAQGYADESAWARGQAWGFYGYTLCYRYTKDPKYLQQAEGIARFIFNNPTLPSDLIPYWDYNAPGIPDEPRDASAAAITASALYELSTYVPKKQGKRYKALADKMVETLGSPAYRAEAGKNGNFILMHSTGNKPGNGEVDVPLVYADYYFIEALKRKRDLEAK